MIACSRLMSPWPSFQATSVRISANRATNSGRGMKPVAAVDDETERGSRGDRAVMRAARRHQPAGNAARAGDAPRARTRRLLGELNTERSAEPGAAITGIRPLASSTMR